MTHRPHSFALAAACLPLIGCTADLYYPTMHDVKQLASEGRKQLDAHDANMTEQHKAMSPEQAEAINAQRDEFLRLLAESGRRTDAMESRLHQLVGQVGESLAAAAAARLGIEGLTPKVEQAANRSDSSLAAVSRLEGDVKLVSAGIVQLDKAVDAAAAQADTVEDRLNLVAIEAERRVIDAQQAIDRRIQQVADQATVASSSLSGQALEAIRVAREDVAGLQKKIEESGVTAAQIESMTTEELVAWLASLIGGIGLGGGAMVRTFGPSRSANKIDTIEAKLSDLQKDVALHRPPPHAAAA